MFFQNKVSTQWSVGTSDCNDGSPTRTRSFVGLTQRWSLSQWCHRKLSSNFKNIIKVATETGESECLPTSLKTVVKKTMLLIQVYQ